MFEDLAIKGYVSNDLTDAALGPVTHFKAQFGGKLAVSHVLEARVSPRYSAIETAVRLTEKGKGAAARLVRGIARRKNSAPTTSGGDR